MTYSFHPAARRELKEAIDRYEGRDAGLGYEYSVEVHNALQRIADFPEAWEQASRDPAVSAEAIPVCGPLRRRSGTHVHPGDHAPPS
jgi:hypothetical protein